MQERTESHLSNNQTCQEACKEKKYMKIAWLPKQTFIMRAIADNIINLLLHVPVLFLYFYNSVSQALKD